MLSRYRCHTGVLLLVDQSPITCRRDRDCASQAKNSKQAPSARDAREDAEKFNYPRPRSGPFNLGKLPVIKSLTSV